MRNLGCGQFETLPNKEVNNFFYLTALFTAAFDVSLQHPFASQVQMSMPVSLFTYGRLIFYDKTLIKVCLSHSNLLRIAHALALDRWKCRPGPQDHACRFNSTLPDLFTLRVNILSHCFGEHIISGLTSKYSSNSFCLFHKCFRLIIEYESWRREWKLYIRYLVKNGVNVK